MNKLIFLITLVPALSIAQKKMEKLESYTASNEITYKIGDQITLNRGSGINGNFVYVTMGGWAMSANAEDNQLPAANAGLIITIKKIIKYNLKTQQGIRFTVGGGNITNYMLDIENAIATCEITPCAEGTPEAQESKYDKLREIKKLLDEGILTQEEYEAEKKKILDNQ